MKANLLCAVAILGSVSRPGWAGGSEHFTAHEWGTFTSVQGADGVQIQWNPLVRTDLPSFVYDLSKLAAGGCGDCDFPEKAALSALIRMETPVIYFYSPTAREVSVRVEFPEGRLTEWYPRASRVGPRLTVADPPSPDAHRSFIEWKDVRVLPPATTEVSAGQLIRTRDDNHYYAARETKANLLRVEAPGKQGKPEYERLLFYRGVGNFQSPLQVTISRDETGLELSTTNSVPIRKLFALTIQRGQARYARVPEVSCGDPRTVSLSAGLFSPLAEVRRHLMAEMQVALIDQGLYADEAAAMVNTWKDQWFGEEGTRVLYLLPGDWTDHVLPLAITPAPTQVVRVMVGRSEVILPCVERELRQQIVRYISGDPAIRARAVAGVCELGLGRFLDPAVKRVLATTENQWLAGAAWEMSNAAGAELSRKGVKQGPYEVEQAVPTPPSPRRTRDLATAF
jgi:hypothetical protein